MSRGDSASRIMVHQRAGERFNSLKNGYAPIEYIRIVINNCYYQTLTVTARVGTGKFSALFIGRLAGTLHFNQEQAIIMQRKISAEKE